MAHSNLWILIQIDNNDIIFQSHKFYRQFTCPNPIYQTEIRSKMLILTMIQAAFSKLEGQLMGLFSLTMLRSDYSYQCIVNITPEELKRNIIQTVAVDEQCLVTEFYYIHLFQKILMCFWRKVLLTTGNNFKKVLLLHFHLNSQHSISNEIDSLNAKLRLFQHAWKKLKLFLPHLKRSAWPSYYINFLFCLKLVSKL